MYTIAKSWKKMGKVDNSWSLQSYNDSLQRSNDSLQAYFGLNQPYNESLQSAFDALQAYNAIKQLNIEVFQ